MGSSSTPQIYSEAQFLPLFHSTLVPLAFLLLTRYVFFLRTMVVHNLSVKSFSCEFLSQFDDYKNDLRQVIHGNNTIDGVYITLRMRLRCEIFRHGKAVPGKIFDVLNEIVVDRGSNPYLSKIECYEHDRLITKVRIFHT